MKTKRKERKEEEKKKRQKQTGQNTESRNKENDVEGQIQTQEKLKKDRDKREKIRETVAGCVLIVFFHLITPGIMRELDMGEHSIIQEGMGKIVKRQGQRE